MDAARLHTSTAYLTLVALGRRRDGPSHVPPVAPQTDDEGAPRPGGSATPATTGSPSATEITARAGTGLFPSDTATSGSLNRLLIGNGAHREGSWSARRGGRRSPRDVSAVTFDVNFFFFFFLGRTSSMIMTDDQTLRDMEVLPRVRAAIGAQGVTFSDTPGVVPAVLPRPGLAAHRPVLRTTTTCWATSRRTAATGGSTSANTLPGRARAGRLRDRPTSASTSTATSTSRSATSLRAGRTGTAR